MTKTVLETALDAEMTDARGWPDVARRDPVIADAQQQLPGLRPCGFHSPYEAAAWAVLSQRVRIVQAATLRAEVPLKGPTIMHDFAITARHAVFLDLPMTFQPRPGVPFGWDDSYGARLGVMPLDTPGEATWFEVDPCYVFHVGNAHETPDGRIVLDVARYGPADIARVWDSIGPGASGPSTEMVSTGVAALHRWKIDSAVGTVTESDLSDQGLEFPTVDDTRVGRPHRYLYVVSEARRGSERNAILSYDLDRGGVVAHDLATDVAAAPVARVTLPRGVPAGFHGAWMPDAADAV